MSWTLQYADPATRRRLARRAAGDRRRTAAFWVNAALNVAREVRLHRDLPAHVDARIQRLTTLDADLATVRAQLRELTPRPPR